MINYTDYGLTEKNINMDYYNKLTDKGKKVHCEELAKAKARATHLITFENTRGEEKEMYWFIELGKIPDAVSILENYGCVVLAVTEVKRGELV